MYDRHVRVPAAPGLEWVIRRTQLSPADTRPARGGDAPAIAAGFASTDCPRCARFVESAMQAIALALDDYRDGAGDPVPDDDEPPFGATD